jgi:hypothetical protein
LFIDLTAIFNIPAPLAPVVIILTGMLGLANRLVSAPVFGADFLPALIAATVLIFRQARLPFAFPFRPAAFSVKSSLLVVIQEIEDTSLIIIVGKVENMLF